MTLEQGIGLGLTLLLAIAAAFWVMVRIIVGQFKEAADERNEIIDKRLSALEAHSQSSSIAVNSQRIAALEGRFETMHEWKNGALEVRLDRMFENAISHADHRDSELSRRLDLLERKVLNGSSK